MPLNDVQKLEADLQVHFLRLRQEQRAIADKLVSFADGKLLKGDEIVGWLGEVYGKLLLDGTLVADTEEHDFVAAGNMRVSVKTRRGSGGGWNQTGVIPKISGDACPTHLMFVHLAEDYQIDRVWLFPWEHLVASGRFKPKTVRDEARGFTFSVKPAQDATYIIYASATAKVPQSRTIKTSATPR